MEGTGCVFAEHAREYRIINKDYLKQYHIQRHRVRAMKDIPLKTQIPTTHTSTYDLEHWTNTEQDNLKHFPKETLKTCQLDNTLHILRTTYLVLLAIQKLTDRLTMRDQSLAIRAHLRLVLSYLRAWLEPCLHSATRQHMCLSPQQNCQSVRVSSQLEAVK